MLCFKRVIVKVYGIDIIEISDSLDNSDLIFKYSGLRGGNLVDVNVAQFMEVFNGESELRRLLTTNITEFVNILSEFDTVLNNIGF